MWQVLFVDWLRNTQQPNEVSAMDRELRYRRLIEELRLIDEWEKLFADSEGDSGAESRIARRMRREEILLEVLSDPASGMSPRIH